MTRRELGEKIEKQLEELKKLIEEIKEKVEKNSIIHYHYYYYGYPMYGCGGTYTADSDNWTINSDCRV